MLAIFWNPTAFSNSSCLRQNLAPVSSPSQFPNILKRHNPKLERLTLQPLPKEAPLINSFMFIFIAPCYSLRQPQTQLSADMTIFFLLRWLPPSLTFLMKHFLSLDCSLHGLGSASYLFLYDIVHNPSVQPHNGDGFIFLKHCSDHCLAPNLL